MRLSNIITRSGDDGRTSLADGTRVSKDSERISALGEIDELNSAIGLVLAENLSEPVRSCLLGVQQDLFDLGSELAVPGASRLLAKRLTEVEEAAERFNSTLPPLEEFILPAGVRAAAACHLARTICRRAERTLVGLSRFEAVGENPLKFLNRLSDLLFILARTINRENGCREICWNPER